MWVKMPWSNPMVHSMWDVLPSEVQKWPFRLKYFEVYNLLYGHFGPHDLFPREVYWCRTLCAIQKGSSSVFSNPFEGVTLEGKLF